MISVILNQNNCLKIICTLIVITIALLPFAFCRSRGTMTKTIMAGKLGFIFSVLLLSQCISTSRPYIDGAVDAAFSRAYEAGVLQRPDRHSYSSDRIYVNVDETLTNK